MSFAEKLKYYRSQRQLSQRQLAEEFQVSHSLITMYENGRRKPSFEMLCAIADYFGVRVNDLVADDPPAVTSILDDHILIMPAMIRLPLIGNIACGTPITAQENIEDWVDVPEETRGDFVLRCKGDSMKDARILDGDLVVIRQQDDVQDGQIAAVLIDDEATLKRLFHVPGGAVMLQAANPAYPPMLCGGANEERAIRIIGLATHFISRIV